MDATCAIQASIHVFSLVRKYVSRILGTYQCRCRYFLCAIFCLLRKSHTEPGRIKQIKEYTEKMSKLIYAESRLKIIDWSSIGYHFHYYDRILLRAGLEIS